MQRKLKNLLAIVLFLGTVNLAVAGTPDVFNVKDYGAKGDGKTLETQAINKAIDACAAAGGGTVYLPAGVFLSGSIHLKSNVALYLDSGCILRGAPNDIGAYDPPEPLGFKAYQDYGHSHWHNALIWGENLHDIAILGPGMIDGGGMSRHDCKPGGGDKSISLKLCRNILIKDITMRHAGHFAILPTGCDNMTIDNLTIDTNRDGIDVDCCRNVRISNCSVNSPRDDAIVLKSSYALGFNRATENVTITNCVVSGYKEGTLLDGTFQGGGGVGRIKFGTESNGGFKNIAISNCVFDHCRGLALEEVDGGNLENVTISNIALRDVANSPIFIRLGNRARGPAGTPVGKVRNVTISNVTVFGVNPIAAVLIAGIPGHPVTNVQLNNIRVVSDGGGTAKDAEIVPPELEKAYPEPWKFGRMPAYGFFCRHVSGLELHNVAVAFKTPDERPGLICDDVNGLELDDFRAERVSENKVPLVLKNVKKLFLHDCPEIHVVATQCKSLSVSQKKGAATAEFEAKAQIRGSREGLAEITLLADGNPLQTKYVWVFPGKEKQVVFENIGFGSRGVHHLTVGAVTKKVRVR